MSDEGTCGHCGQAGHYRPRCPAFNGGAHEVVTALLREVEGPAARAPSGHAGGEASALRRAVAALGVQP